MHLLARIEAIPSARIATTATVVVLGCIGGTWFADPTGDAGLIGAALSFGAGSAWALVHNRRIERLPLALSSAALRGRVGARTAIRVRARLGRGRMMQDVRGEFTWVDGDERTPLTPLLPHVESAVGPVTFVIPHDGDTGRLEVHVRAAEGSTTHSATASYDLTALPEGRFGADLSFEGGRLRVDPERWQDTL